MQCGKQPLFRNNAGHVLCLDCYVKFQQALNEQMVLSGSYQNYLIEGMMFSMGLSDTPPQFKPPKINRTTMNQGPFITIDNSNIGLLNAGQMQEIESININLSNLSASGQSDVVQALKAITEAVVKYPDLTTVQRTESLDQLNELSKQAALPPEKRSGLGVLRAIFSSLSVSLAAGGGLAEIWSTWEPTISKYFHL